MASAEPASSCAVPPLDAASGAWATPPSAAQQQEQMQSAANGADTDMIPGPDSSDASAGAGSGPETGSGTSGRLATLPPPAPFDMFAQVNTQIEAS